MVHRRQNLTTIFTALAVGFASLPAAVMSVNSFFGLGSLLVVPLFAVGVWFTLRSPTRESRAWWFGFTVAVGMFPPFCPIAERWSCNVAAYLQRQAQRGILPLPVDFIELGCLLSIVLCPAFAALLSGFALGNFARRLERRTMVGSSSAARWQFSVRELLVAMAALALLLACNSRFTTQRGAEEMLRQRAFLARFEESFRSDGVKLLAKPVISEGKGPTISMSAFSLNAPGTHEYRIVAPIEEGTSRRWAVWAYTTNEDANGLIYEYAQAEAEREQQVPRPAPVKRYIEGTWEMVDGIPSTAGPSAANIVVTPPARLGEPLVLTARAPAGTVCELDVFPRTEATARLEPRAPDKNGLVRWFWTPEWAGPFNYELKCVEKRRSGPLVNRQRGTIPQFIVGATKDK